MKNRKKKKSAVCISMLLCISLLCGGCGSAGGSDTKVAGDAIADDKYRTFYEIFPYSFCDSDGDEIGDLKGIISRLDYLNDGDTTTDTDLGMNGIWLMPIMPSPSYHKYDVTDYRSIDPEYGTMDDFKALMSECEKREIHVILDLVMNHTSSEHPWFQEACNYLESLPTGSEPDAAECPYVNYYHFSKEKKDKYHQVGNSEWYYEGQFWSGMPDLNLKNEAVEAEFEHIADFWLSLGVSGFRLDAVGEYETGSVSESTGELKHFVETMHGKNPDIYIVGEVWSDMATYTQYYQSGIDSCFDFAFADSTGIIANSLKGAKGYDASSFGKAQVNIQDMIQANNPEGIDAPFYTNHDMARSAGYYSGENSEAQTKIAQAMNLLMSGNTFLYYGEELGMKGSGKDENKRAPMYWSTDRQAEGMCKGPADMDSVKMKYGSLEEQEIDGDSIYQFVKETIRLRNALPELARGTVAFEESCSNESICTIRKTYEGNELLLVYNLSAETAQMDIGTLSLNGTDKKSLAGVLLTGTEAITYEKGSLSMPAYSVALLR